MIGLPTSEVANVLVILVAGHEIGHSLWVAIDGQAQYDPQITAQLRKVIEPRLADVCGLLNFQGTIDDLFKTADGIAKVRDYSAQALLQCEEVFCDLLGLRLFGEVTSTRTRIC